MPCGRIDLRLVLLLPFLALAPAAARAQTCPDPGSYCEGWARDSSRREVSLSRETQCTFDVFGTCSATCSTAPITALPSIRVGSLEHVVLGFAVSDACPPECPANSVPEPCYNLGVSYRNVVSSGSETFTGPHACDLSDPFTIVSAGATFNATYQIGGTVNIVVTNVVYGLGTGPDDCGAQPTALDLSATGPSLGIQSHFTFTWAGSEVTAYTESRTYTNLPPPNTVNISVSSINYGAGTYTVSAPDAVTATRGRSWGELKLRYR